VVGSDEVWNFRHPWYAACPAFFGEGIRADRLISYAASFGCHDAQASMDPAWSARLERFAAIAVRDENSLRLVRESLGHEPTLVLDPCLQFDAVCRRPAADSPDQAIVYGHGFPDEFVRSVRSWASARGVRLVSVGYRNDWADEQWLTAGPEDFALAMGAARAVVTNFFHGCVFALLNEKPFVCTTTEYRWHKVQALVRALAAEDRLIVEPAPQAAFDAALDAPPVMATRNAIASLRERSADYLEHALA
jgi:polysaccharide pyruvyl transferase WcaK-like protein